MTVCTAGGSTGLLQAHGLNLALSGELSEELSSRPAFIAWTVRRFPL